MRVSLEGSSLLTGSVPSGKPIERKVRTASAEIARPNSQPCASVQPKSASALRICSDSTPFGSDRHVEIVAKSRNRADDGGSLFAFYDRGDEALVDLDSVERQPVDLGKARVAGTEIVERNADSDILQAVDDGQHLIAVFEQRAFGDLDLEPVRRKAHRRRAVLRICSASVGIAELDRRDVDRELEVGRPAACFLERLFKDAERQRTDQSGPLGSLDERLGFDEAAARRAPAREGLEADDLAAPEIDQWLEERNELAGLDAAADLFLQLQPFGELALQFLVEPGNCSCGPTRFAA